VANLFLMRIKLGRVISMDYVVRLDTGRVVETSSGRSPVEYLHGSGQILPALERALEGLREGDQASFSIACEDAYGTRKDDNVVSLPRTMFPNDVQLQKGLCLYAKTSGQSYPITVREVQGDMVLVDLNHPLAGERLFFEVNIRGVRPAGQRELFEGKAEPVEVV
jgi:FKBP-type peptidyl-prolyl cis-trans isomerase SlyD